MATAKVAMVTVCSSGQPAADTSATLSYMATNNRAEFRRLILKTERDLLTEAQLKALLTVAEATVADDRQTLRKIKARIKRARPR